MFSKYTSNKSLVSRIYKEFQKLNNKQRNKQVKRVINVNKHSQKT